MVCYLIRLSFKLEKYYFYKEEIDEPTFLKKTSSLYDSDYMSPGLNQYGYDEDLGLSIIPALKICSIFNDKLEPRPIIATIGFPESLKTKIKNEAGAYRDMIKFKDYSSIDEMEDAIKDKSYGNYGNELICFGIYFRQYGHKNEYSLHYFDS